MSNSDVQMYTADRNDSGLPYLEIPDEGVPFEIRHTVDGEEVITTLVLRETLCGLRTVPKVADGRSQAFTFASYAVQRGFTTEEKIFEKNPEIKPQWMKLRDQSHPDKPVMLGEHGQELTYLGSRSWSLIDPWRSAVESAQQAKAVATQKENRNRISDPQRDLARNLVDQLAAKHATAWNTLIDSLGHLSVCDDEDAPLGWKISQEINKAYKVLGIQRRPSPTRMTGPAIEEEPF